MSLFGLIFPLAYANIRAMEKNNLEKIRVERGLTYEGLGSAVGYDRSSVWEHCRKTIPAEAAIRYSAALGIPLSQLRPDLPPPVVQPQGQEVGG